MSIDSYSGVIVDRFEAITESDDYVTLSAGTTYYQNLTLPSNYAIGDLLSERHIPALTGIQVFVRVDDADLASIQWTFGWQQTAAFEILAQGITTGAHTDGDCWFDIYFEEPVVITESMLDSVFRLSIEGIASVSRWWWFNPSGRTRLTYQERAYYDAEETQPIVEGDNDVSMAFKLLGESPDNGVDLLGNRYRTLVLRNVAENLSTNDSEDEDALWWSKPNPSRFAVENLYFDMRSSAGQATTTDRLLVDPVTPNVYFSVYYSNDTDESNWDNKLWARVPKTFQARRRETHVFPEPVTASFFKIEFTHLEARYYAPGIFQKPIRYQKHPKWVLDYFMTRLEDDTTNDYKIARSTVVRYNALDLGYNYYLDDLASEPDLPVFIDPHQEGVVRQFFKTKDVKDYIDSETLLRINTAFQKYTDYTNLMGRFGDVITSHGWYLVTLNQLNMPNEDLNAVDTAIAATNTVSSLRRDAILYEKLMPVMYFFITCRHGYRTLEASFSHDRAYFVGLRQIAFLRDNFSQAYDAPLYVENTGDKINSSRNDFVLKDQRWVVHKEQ